MICKNKIIYLINNNTKQTFTNLTDLVVYTQVIEGI